MAKFGPLYLLAWHWILAASNIQVAIASPSACAEVRKSVGQADMINQVTSQYYSIGYTSLDVVATQTKPSPGTCGLQYGQMKNKMGNLVTASPTSIQASILVGPSSCPGFGLCANIVDTDSPTGWPMSFLSYIVVPRRLKDASCATATSYSPSCSACLKLKTVYDYIKWIISSTEASAVLNANSFASLPSYVTTRIQNEILPDISCAGLDNNFTSVTQWPSDVQAVNIIGGGSSVQGQVQIALANAFNIDSSVSISFAAYAPKQLSRHLIDFESRDFLFDTNDAAVLAEQHVMIPVMASAIVPVYNLEKYQKLTFTRSALSGLFLGTLTSWVDPVLRATNPSAVAPPEVPIRVVRADPDPQDGVPLFFIQSIQSFANLSGSDQGRGDLSWTPDKYAWPVQAAAQQSDKCSNKACRVQICDPGSFFDEASNACEECPVGTYAINVGSLSCTPCPPGTYTDVVGTKGCAKCDDTSYQPDIGSDHCVQCPANTRRYGVLTPSQAASPNVSASYVFGSHLEECMCLVGYWLPQSVNNSELGGLSCSLCPEGASCAGFTNGLQHIPQSSVNFWGDPTNPGAFFECAVGHCLSNYNCSSGYTGRFCNSPAPGYYYVAGVVKKCEPGIGSMLIFFTVLEALAWIVLVNFACSQYHSLSIDMIMLQTSGYIAKLKLRWDPNVDTIRIVAEFFNFEVGYIGHQCSTDTWNDANLFYWQLSFPFLSVLLCILWWTAKTGFKKLASWNALRRLLGRKEEQDLKLVRVIKNKSTLASLNHTTASFRDYVWIKFLMFFLTWYPVLVFTTFTPFTCKADAHGHPYLTHMPDVPCWQEQHWSMIYVACVYIPIMIVAIPVVLGRRLYWGLKADLLNRCSFMECYGWIYSKYKCEYAWWEMVVLLRRALVCLCAVLVDVPMVSACLIIFVLNLFLCAQLVFRPHAMREIRILEVGSLFSCMVQAVAGILLYPSLDASNECVGSTYLEEIGAMCDSNSTYKRAVTVIVLLIFCTNLLTSVLLFLWKLHRNWVAAAAVRRVHAALSIPYDEYDIHLSNIVDGSYLVSLLRDPHLAASPDVRRRFARLNDSIPYFIMFNHTQSGHYSQNEYARTLNRLLDTFPGLLDWVAQADRGLVAGFAAFVRDYAAYAREHHSVAFGQIILTAHKTDVLMWLMTCTNKHREAFCKLLLGVAAASGMSYFLRPGRVRDDLLAEAEQQHTNMGLRKFAPPAACDDSPPAACGASAQQGWGVGKAPGCKDCAGVGELADGGMGNGALVDVINTGCDSLAEEARLCAAVCNDG